MAIQRRKKAVSNSEADPLRALQSNSGFPIVGVGGSAGGIEAFTTLLKRLPDAPGMAFVFVLHQDPKHTSNLAQVLARATQMPVDGVQAGMRPEVNRLYLAPADAEVSVVNGILRLHDRAAGGPSVIDGFLRSLADDQGSRAISIVLSGSGSDGTVGTRAIKAEGGITFAQDDSAKVNNMPRSASAAGFVDFVLPPEEIADELVRIAEHDYVTGDGSSARLPEKDLTKLFRIIQSKHDIDFTNYKPSTIERRIRRRMALHNVGTVEKYLPLVRQNPAEVEQLYADILIRVTGFFRDPQAFEALQKDVFPEILHNRRDDEAVRVWVPGCATGEEVYSITIALMETVGKSGHSCPIQIFGTDVSELALDRARAGIYPATITSDVSEERLRRFFTPSNAGYRVSKDVRDCCIFARQNVTKDPPFSKLDLISCRNVMIYFESTLQRRVVTIFHYALRPRGFLLLGRSETIGSFRELFDMVDRKEKIYRKKSVAVRPNIDFGTVERIPAAEGNAVEPDFASDFGPPQNPVSREADRVLLSRYAPPGVVVNENLEILQFRGRTSRYLELPSGAATFNLMKMAREGLLAGLRKAIQGARKTNAPERREGVATHVNGDTFIVNIEAIPFAGAANERLFLVLFEEQQPKKKGKREKQPARSSSRQTNHLKRELEATREYLQSIIGEQENMNEVLRFANEEIHSSNEELQSTNEELETAKEELQSTNEELTTLNEELENRNQQMAIVNNDLLNLLSSVEIPIVMLDSARRVRRLNPVAQRTLNLIPGDVGRPLSDLKTTLQMENLDSLVDEVIDTLEVREVQVKDRNGRQFSLRIRPYRTADNKIDGAVLVLLDLEEFRKNRPGS